MINIALSTDQNLLPHMGAVVRSIIDHTTKPVNFHIMTRGVSQEQFDAVINTYPDDFPGQFYHHYPMDNYDFGKVRLARWVTLSTMDRIFMPSILPDVRKIIYLDIDVVVNADLADMPMDTGECGIAAKQSTREGFKTNAEYDQRTGGQKVVELCGEWPNFNAGVMVMDLDRLREYGMQEFCIALVEATGCNDQIAFASYSRGRFERLPAEWNTWVGMDHLKIKNPKIIHYVGSRKPWNGPTPLKSYWLQYAGQ